MPKKTSLNKGLQALLGDVASPKQQNQNQKRQQKNQQLKQKTKTKLSLAKLKQTNTNQGFRLMRKSCKSLQSQ